MNKYLLQSWQISVLSRIQIFETPFYNKKATVEHPAYLYKERYSSGYGGEILCNQGGSHDGRINNQRHEVGEHALHPSFAGSCH